MYPHIPQGFGACLTQKKVGIFVQAQEGIDVQKLGKAELSSLTVSEKTLMTKEIAKALLYIHMGSPFPYLVHGDINALYEPLGPHNILLDTHGAHAYLIDLDWTVEQVVSPTALEGDSYLVKDCGNISEAQREEVMHFGLFMN